MSEASICGRGVTVSDVVLTKPLYCKMFFMAGGLPGPGGLFSILANPAAVQFDVSPSAGAGIVHQKGRVKMKRITITLPDALIDGMDAIIDDVTSMPENRSQFIRVALMRYFEVFHPEILCQYLADISRP